MPFAIVEKRLRFDDTVLELGSIAFTPQHRRIRPWSPALRKPHPPSSGRQRRASYDVPVEFPRRQTSRSLSGSTMTLPRPITQVYRRPSTSPPQPPQAGPSSHQSIPNAGPASGGAGAIVRSASVPLVRIPSPPSPHKVSIHTSLRVGSTPPVDLSRPLQPEALGDVYSHESACHPPMRHLLLLVETLADRFNIEVKPGEGGSYVTVGDVLHRTAAVLKDKLDTRKQVPTSFAGVSLRCPDADQSKWKVHFQKCVY